MIVHLYRPGVTEAVCGAAGPRGPIITAAVYSDLCDTCLTWRRRRWGFQRERDGRS